jgi:NAD-dependent dihydropyrimidine dehydrogenase PreA subunit
MIAPEIDVERCTGCGDCVLECPVHALALEQGHAVLAHAEDCQYCGDCEELCPEGAIARPFEIVWGEASARPGEQGQADSAHEIR